VSTSKALTCHKAPYAAWHWRAWVRFSSLCRTASCQTTSQYKQTRW